jgi:predicted dienelactone hydrolase
MFEVARLSIRAQISQRRHVAARNCEIIMKHLFAPFLLTPFILATLLLAQAMAADAIGFSTLSVPVPERGGTMEVSLWYPAGAGGSRTLVGDSALFKGMPAQRDALPTSDIKPLILLSHGGLKSGPDIGAWMASRLAADGFMVAMLRQPDPHSQTTAQSLHEIWLRPADLTAALTAIENDATLSARIDKDKVGVLGFLVGGTSALALAGARLDPEAFARSCDPGGTGVDCVQFAKEGIDLRSIDTESLTRSHLDRRIKSIVVIDPEFSTDFSAASLGTISIPTEIINLGTHGTIWPGLHAAGLEHSIPGAHYGAVADATQYSAFSECKQAAP